MADLTQDYWWGFLFSGRILIMIFGKFLSCQGCLLQEQKLNEIKFNTEKKSEKC